MVSPKNNKKIDQTLPQVNLNTDNSKVRLSWAPNKFPDSLPKVKPVEPIIMKKMKVSIVQMLYENIL